MAMTPKAKTLARLAKAAILIGLIFGRHRIPLAVQKLFTLPLEMKFSMALWLAFSIYWSIAAKDSAATKSSESRSSRCFHLILVNGALLLLVLPIPGLTRRFLPANSLLVAFGLMIQAAFILLALWARRHLGDNWSGRVRISTVHQLVRSGPYRFVRHPIYTAVLGMYCGTALVSGEIHAPLALTSVALAYWRKVRLEESALSQAFPSEHTIYREKTWALIPGLY